MATNVTPEEQHILVRLPRWIAAGASAVQPDNAAKTHAELEAGFIAVANGRQAGNAFLAVIANLAMGLYDEDLARSGVSVDSEAGIDDVLERAAVAFQRLRVTGDAVDVTAYGRWLLDITDDVINAARSGDVLGVGGVLVSPAEQRFRDRLAQSLGHSSM